MRANSHDAAGESHSGGGARRFAPNIFYCLVPWVFLCLLKPQRLNRLSYCVL
jgi:hypothetical protein